MTACRICFSPYRHEIEMLAKKGVPILKIAKKFAQILNLKEESLYKTIQGHLKNDHATKVKPNTGAISAQGYPSSINALKVVEFETVAQALLESAVKDLKENESGLSIKDKLTLASKLEKTNLDKKKLDLGESALKLQIAKLFGGFTNPQEIEDGNK